MDTHVKVLGVLYIILGVILAICGVALLAIIGGAGAVSGAREAMLVTGIVGTVLCGVLLVLSLPNLLAGYGLLKRREWARILAIVLGIIHLVGFPVGTAIGVYTLYVLFNDETKRLFT
jgi:hypothetical protein